MSVPSLTIVDSSDLNHDPGAPEAVPDVGGEEGKLRMLLGLLKK
jgi:hypothetical protein